jgi:hypothetical protein
MTVVAYVVVVGLCLVAAVESTRFTIRYSRVNYRRTPEGRHLMGLSRALGVALWTTLLSAAFELIAPIPLWVAAMVQTIVFGWLAFEMNRRNRLFTAAQREAYAARHRTRKD